MNQPQWKQGLYAIKERMHRDKGQSTVVLYSEGDSFYGKQMAWFTGGKAQLVDGSIVGDSFKADNVVYISSKDTGETLANEHYVKSLQDKSVICITGIDLNAMTECVNIDYDSLPTPKLGSPMVLTVVNDIQQKLVFTINGPLVYENGTIPSQGVARFPAGFLTFHPIEVNGELDFRSYAGPDLPTKNLIENPVTVKGNGHLIDVGSHDSVLESLINDITLGKGALDVREVNLGIMPEARSGQKSIGGLRPNPNQLTVEVGTDKGSVILSTRLIRYDIQ